MQSYDGTVYPVLRRVATSGLRGYGPGIAQLEKIIQEVLQDMVEDLAVKAGQPISSHKICNSYVSSVIVYVVSCGLFQIRLVDGPYDVVESFLWKKIEREEPTPDHCGNYFLTFLFLSTPSLKHVFGGDVITMPLYEADFWANVLRLGFPQHPLAFY